MFKSNMLTICNLYNLYAQYAIYMQSTCKDIKNIPNPMLFIKIIFLLALKILKTSIFCNIFCIFAKCILISERVILPEGKYILS